MDTAFGNVVDLQVVGDTLLWVGLELSADMGTTCTLVEEQGGEIRVLAEGLGDVQRMAVTSRWVYLCQLDEDLETLVLVRVSRSTGEWERLCDLDVMHLAVTRSRDLIYAAGGQLFLMNDEGHETGLIDLPGPGSDHVVALRHRVFGRLETRVNDLRGVLARIAMLSSMVCTRSDIFYVAAGDAITHNRVYCLPRRGGEPTVFFEGEDDGDAHRFYGRLGHYGSALLVETGTRTRRGQILGSRLDLADPDDGRVLASLDLAGASLTALCTHETRLVLAQQHAPGEPERIVQLDSFMGRPRTRAQRVGGGLATNAAGIIYGDGERVVRLPW